MVKRRHSKSFGRKLTRLNTKFNRLGLAYENKTYRLDKERTKKLRQIQDEIDRLYTKEYLSD